MKESRAIVSNRTERLQTCVQCFKMTKREHCFHSVTFNNWATDCFSFSFPFFFVFLLSVIAHSLVQLKYRPWKGWVLKTHTHPKHYFTLHTIAVRRTSLALNEELSWTCRWTIKSFPVTHSFEPFSKWQNVH